MQQQQQFFKIQNCHLMVTFFCSSFRVQYSYRCYSLQRGAGGPGQALLTSGMYILFPVCLQSSHSFSRLNLPGLNKYSNHPSLSHSKPSISSDPVLHADTFGWTEKNKTCPILYLKIKGHLFTFSELLIMSGYQKQGFRNIPHTFI